jgi:pyruvate dehydrogenase E1 component
MPKGVSEGILKGMYRFKAGEQKAGKPRVQLLGSGAILNEALKAQALLEGDYGVTADVWSVTSFKELHNDGVDAQRWNMLNPKKKPQIPYVTQCLSETEGPVIVASDYVKALGNSVVRWMPGKPVVLGTDGFGRSESREELRDFFEVDHRHITLGALHGLVQEGKLKPDAVAKAMKKLDVDPNRPDPSKS